MANQLACFNLSNLPVDGLGSKAMGEEAAGGESLIY